ncbi:hypothetical protein [Haladaptatus sp. DFWS20]|uniref:hypothetical protein n=1 Tax=Haladaptatus sp. DFWS20 TaxID=3403467 RepID=UPI003EB6B92D
MAQQLQQRPEQYGTSQQSQSQPQRYRPSGQETQQQMPQPQGGQQFQQPQGQQTQQPQTQQFQQQPGQIGQQIRNRYQESVPSEVRLAVEDLEKVSTTAEWAKMKATQRGLPRVATICDDIQEISELQKKLIIRQSPLSHVVGQCSQQVIQEGLQQLQQHMNEPEVKDTIEKVQQSLDSINKGLTALQSVGDQQTGEQMGHGSGQMGQRSEGLMGQQSGRQMGSQVGGMGQQFGTQQSGQFPGQQY